ncbi:hypothetical protein Tco_0421344 [Tanacetum coccineum]
MEAINLVLTYVKLQCHELRATNTPRTHIPLLPNLGVLQSPLSPWSLPLPQIPSKPLPVSSPVPVSPPPLPASPTYPLRYRAAMIRLRAEKPSTSHPLPLSTPPSGTLPLLPIPLPTPSPPLLLPSTNCRAGAPMTDDTELGRQMTEFATMVKHDTDEIYRRLDEAQDARVREAKLSREAWGQPMDASDIARSEVRALRTTVLAQQTEIAGLRPADPTLQAQLVETLALLRTLQTHVTVLQSQQGPASGPAQPEIPEEAGSSS